MGWELDEDLNTYNQQVLNESELKLLILGGNATDGVQAIVGDPITGLRQWIDNGAEMIDSSLGLPIAYTTNYLKDNRLASFAYACEWTQEECLPVARRFYFDMPDLVGAGFRLQFILAESDGSCDSYTYDELPPTEFDPRFIEEDLPAIQ